MTKGIKRKLMNVHELFLKSIKDYCAGEFLVGTAVYGDDKILTSKSDLDIICVVDRENFKTFLQSKYL